MRRLFVQYALADRILFIFNRKWQPDLILHFWLCTSIRSHTYSGTSLCINSECCYLEYFKATFSFKSHNMKAFVNLSHSWSPFLPLTCLYGENELLSVSVWPSGVFSWEKRRPPPRRTMQITWLWPPVSRFGHDLITVRQKKMWT